MNYAPSQTALFFYEVLLSLYPKDYRKAYGDEMKLLFHDVYSEELEKQGEISIGFWFHLTMDVCTSTINQHILLLSRIGLMKYAKQIFHINTYFVVGILLLLPFLTLFTVDGVDRLLTGGSYILLPLYNSPFWSVPVILTLIIVFPGIAVLLNTLSIVQAYRNGKHKVVSLSFLASQLPSFLILSLGFLAIVLLFGHDMIPCVFNRTLSHGILRFFQGISYCKLHA